MKRKNRAIALIILLPLFAGCFFGCTKKPSGDDESTTAAPTAQQSDVFFETEEVSETLPPTTEIKKEPSTEAPPQPKKKRRKKKAPRQNTQERASPSFPTTPTTNIFRLSLQNITLTKAFLRRFIQFPTQTAIWLWSLTEQKTKTESL